MNSLSSLQGINNKILSVSIPTITVPYGDFGLPVVSANSVVGLNAFTSTSSITYQTWTISCVFTSGGQFNAFLDHSTFPSGLNELNSTYPQCIQIAPDHCAGVITLSQPIYFSNSGTYQLSFYTAPYANAYQTYYTLNASISGSSTGAFSLNSTQGWVNYTLNFNVSSVGNQTLSFVFNCPNNSNSVGIYLTAVTITYLHS
jgi:hypothetical protein